MALRSLAIVMLILQAGCANVPHPPAAVSPCTLSEASYECQIERYHNVAH